MNDIFFSEGKNEGETQYTQLQLLYKARGRQLEDLKSDMEQNLQDSGKERRMLKHQLSLAQGRTKEDCFH